MAKFDPSIHHRRSIRLHQYDYTQAGAYFLTICTQNRECLFGEIVDGVMRLSEAGRMVQSIWDQIPIFYHGVELDEFVIMPNHIHGIVVLVGAGPRVCPELAPRVHPESGQPQGVAPTLSLPDVVHRFKTMTTKKYADGVKQHGWSLFPGKLWQRNYWEHIIRNEAELDRVREYIHNNPAQWALDKLFVGTVLAET